MKSYLHKEVFRVLKKHLPDWRWVEEMPVKIDGETLYIDISCSTPIRVAIEVMGEQHYKFNKFFYKDTHAFAQAQKRDQKKKEWLEENGYYYVIFNYNDKLSERDIISKVMSCLAEE